MTLAMEETTATTPRWLASVLADDHMPPELKARLSSLERWSINRFCGLLDIGRERLWTLRKNTHLSHPHPSRFPDSGYEGEACLWAMQAHRIRWNYTEYKWTPARPRHGAPRTVTTRVPQRTAATRKPARRIDPRRLQRLATERDLRYAERRKAIRTANYPKALKELLLDRQIWTIGDMAAATNLGVARLGLRRTTGRRPAGKLPKHIDWFALPPDTVEGLLPGGRENIGIEAGRARQWAIDNDWLRWDDQIKDLVPTATVWEPMPLADWQDSGWYRSVVNDENMPAELKTRLLDLTAWDRRRAGEELGIGPRALSDKADNADWYPEGDLVPAGWLRLRALQTRRVKWSVTARVFVPTTPRHGRPVKSTAPRRRRVVSSKPITKTGSNRQ